MATGPSTAAQPVHWRALGAARSPSESCSLWGHLTAYGISQAIPQAGTKWSHVTAELIRPLSPSAGDGPAGLGHTSQALPAAELAGGSCLGLLGRLRVLC